MSDAHSNVYYLARHGIYHPPADHEEPCQRPECIINAAVMRDLGKTRRGDNVLIGGLCFVLLCWLVVVVILVAKT